MDKRIFQLSDIAASLELYLALDKSDRVEAGKISLQDLLDFLSENSGSLKAEVFSGSINPDNALGKDGDLYYKTNDSTITVYQKKAGEWEQKAEITTTSSAVFPEGFTVNLPENNTGIPNGTIVEAGDPIAPFLAAAFRKASPAIYVQPVAQLLADQSTEDHEVGESLTINFDLNFVQNDAGAQTTENIKKNGVTMGGASDTITLAIGAVNYQGFILFDDGPVKEDSLGDPDPTGQIVAGTQPSNIISFAGFYKIFYGPTAAAPANSAAVRALASNRFTNDENTFILNTGITEINFALWLPAGVVLTSIIDLDALNLDITEEYVSSALSVNDAAGNPVAGTLYVKSQSVAYTTNHRHSITLT